MKHETEFTNRIWAIAQGENDPEMQQHIGECKQCQEEFAALVSLANLKATAGGELATLADGQIARLSGLFGKYRSVKPAPLDSKQSALERIKVFWAELLHDTGGQYQVAGLRGGASTDTRHVAFVSDLADLDLEITTSESGFAVVGQIGLDSVPKGLEVSFVPADEDPLESTSDRIVRSHVDPDGYFQLEIEAGEWTFAVAVDDAMILFPGVTL